MGKKQEFMAGMRGIMYKDTPMEDRLREVREFADTQTIISQRTAKKYDKPYFVLAYKILNDHYYMKEIPNTMYEYRKSFEDAIYKMRDEYNSLITKGRGYGFRYWFDPVFDNRWFQILEKRFLQLNPEIAEIEGLVRAIGNLKKVGVVDKTLEKRLEELTNGYQADIVARIPSVSKLIRIRELDEAERLSAQGQYKFTTWSIGA